MMELIGYPLVFLLGFFLASAFGLDDLNRLRAELKKYKKGAL